MWVCSPNHGEPLGRAARGPTATESPVFAGVGGLPLGYLLEDWQARKCEMSKRGGVARADAKTVPGIPRRSKMSRRTGGRARTQIRCGPVAPRAAVDPDLGRCCAH